MVDTVPDDFSPSLGIADAEGLEKASDGHIELEGLPNTRDIGGIRAADGRYVKHARLLRSGALAGATERDLEVLLDDFDVRTVIDLRTEEERREKPDPEDGLEGVRFDDAPVLNTSTLGVTREGGIKGALKMLRAVQDDPAQIMMDIYERMVLDEASQRGFASFFDDVLDTPDGAVLWHCTIGKDRAGLAAMLLLHVLGASHERRAPRTSWTRWQPTIWPASWTRASRSSTRPIRASCRRRSTPSTGSSAGWTPMWRRRWASPTRSATPCAPAI